MASTIYGIIETSARGSKPRTAHIDNSREDTVTVDREEYLARVDALLEMLIGIYFRLTKLLTLLPVPIGLPRIGDETDPFDVVHALVRARALILDLPLDDKVRSLLHMTLTEWPAVLDLCALCMMEDEQEEYRIDAIWLMISRLGTLTEMLAPELGLNLDL